MSAVRVVAPMSVRTNPGQIAFAVMPYRPSSTAVDCVRATTAAFDAA